MMAGEEVTDSSVEATGFINVPRGLPSLRVRGVGWLLGSLVILAAEACVTEGSDDGMVSDSNGFLAVES
jgi:hypothetical protein